MKGWDDGGYISRQPFFGANFGKTNWLHEGKFGRKGYLMFSSDEQRYQLGPIQSKVLEMCQNLWRLNFEKKRHWISDTDGGSFEIFQVERDNKSFREMKDS